MKALRETFTCVGDVPWNDIFIGNVTAYDHKVKVGKEPRAVVALSRRTGAMLWIPVRQTKAAWHVRRVWNSLLKRRDVPYGVPVSFWNPISTIIEPLKEAVLNEGETDHGSIDRAV